MATKNQVDKQNDEVQVEPEPGRPQPSAAGAPEGVSKEDVAWWNNSQNRNYMPGDGPQAGITEVDGEAQSVSSVDPEIRAKTLAAEREAKASDNVNPAPVDAGGNLGFPARPKS